MPTVNAICIFSQNGKQLSKNNCLYELSEDDTVADVVNFCRSSNARPSDSQITVFQKRSVGTTVSYSDVDASFTISPNDTYEIMVHTTADDDSSNACDATTSSTSSPRSSNESSHNRSGALSTENELSLEAKYRSLKSEVDEFYQSLNKQTTFKKTNIYNLFNQNIDRLVFYVLSSNTVSNDICLTHLCRERFRRYIRKIVDVEFPSLSCEKSSMLDLYMTLTNWINSDLLSRNRNEILDVVWRSYIKQRYRVRKNNKPATSDSQVVIKPNCRKRKSGVANNVNDQMYATADRELQPIARLMLENKTVDEIAALFKQSTEHRYCWIQYMLKQPDLENGIAEIVLERFPRLLDNVSYLHDDYVYFTKKMKFPICNVAEVFRHLMPGIVELALSLNVISEKPDVRHELKAGEVLALLVQRYLGSPARRCSTERYIIGSTDAINIKQIIRHKDELGITAPMIAYVKCRNDVEYYIIVDQQALKVQGSFADALQSLHELQFVLNLEYDKSVAPLFVFLEYVLGFKSRECNSRYRLKHDIESFISST